jgi:hypothetical protein
MAPDHIARRAQVLAALHDELVGPAPSGAPIDCRSPIAFDDVTATFNPWHQAENGEEILVRDRPAKRYGVAVLSPPGNPSEEAAPGAPENVTPEVDPSEAREAEGEDALTSEAAEELAKAVERAGRETGSDDSDFELAAANSYRPSTMAVTLHAELLAGSRVTVNVTGGRYVRKQVAVPGGERLWWLRIPVTASATFGGRDPPRCARSTSRARCIRDGEPPSFETGGCGVPA